MELTNRNFIVVIAAAGLAASVALVNAGTQPAPGPVAVPAASTESFEYFPSQFTLNAPAMPSAHIQAF